MKRQLTIVAYHYVRDLGRSRYPAIKGLTIERFRRQLDYIQNRYTPISAEDLWEALSFPKRDLPANAILLTFDDGYVDHFANVFPLLDSRGIQGCFFPPAQPILEHKLLDVNKIHFVLAAVPDHGALLDQVFADMAEFRSRHSLKSREDYLTMTQEHRYDNREVTLLKRLLQRELPEPVRAEIVRRLFTEHVTSDEAAFACELYMSMEQITCMRRHGMHIGCHGYTHVWLNRVSQEVQAVEVDRALEFLEQLGVAKDHWTICYPYGGFDDSLLRILRDRHCQLGFTVEARIADLDSDNRLKLPRVDTNDLPS